MYVRFSEEQSRARAGSENASAALQIYLISLQKLVALSQ